MRIRRIRNRLLQIFYRPPSANRLRALNPRAFTELDEIDKAIEQKITPLLAGFWGE